MKNLISLTAMTLAALTTAANAQDFQTGLSELAINDQFVERPLTGFVWYPTEQMDGHTTFHGNPVWQGIEAIGGAEPAVGAFPLLVLSHGMYGNAMNQSWFATEMAKQGYIVAAIHHPGTSSWLRDPDDSRQLWERPRDISRVIDHVLEEERFEIDPDRIFMAGHSLGGWTAMMLAGADYRQDQLQAFCGARADDIACGALARWKVGETDEDRARMEADWSDPRISGFAVFDLGGTQSFAPESLSKIDMPIVVIGAPNPDSGLDLDDESRALAAMLPAATYLEPEGLSHFDFMGQCTEAAIDILKAEHPGEEYVCFDGGDARKADHQMIIEEVSAFFGN